VIKCCFRRKFLSVCNIFENNMQGVPSMYYMKEEPYFVGPDSWGRKLHMEDSCLVLSET
jgi:hypothetical protein